MKILIYKYLFILIWSISAIAVNTPTDFQKFVIDNTLINKWYKYYDDLALRDEFTALLNGTGGSHAKMIAFADDYGDATLDVVNKFRANSKLIKHWDNLDDIASIRNQIKVLEDHHRLISDVDIHNHIHLGDVYPNVSYNSNGVAMNTGIKLSGKHNRAINFDGFPPGSGKWAYESIIATDDLGLGYQYGKLVRNCEDIPDLSRLDAQGNPLPWRFKTKDANGNNTFTSIKTKIDETTTWPDTYSQKKIDAYTTYAYQNMNFDRPVKGNFVFVGKQPDGIYIEFAFDNIDPSLSTTKRLTTYPILK